MVHKDFYVILGVPRAAEPEAVRRAFRERAMEYHPDRAGPGAESDFRDLIEAYEVLSDPDRRRAYDRSRGFDGSRVDVAEPMFGVHSADREVEPFAPNAPLSGRFTVEDMFADVRPSAEGLFERFRRNFTHTRVPKGERPEALHMNVTVDEVEAARGARLEIAVPTFVGCVLCAGSGRGWTMPCPRCGGAGVLRRDARAAVRIPPGVHDGQVVEVPLGRFGISNLLLRVRVNVVPWRAD